VHILIHGINFSPELTGIGKYSGEMAEWLSAQGHEVRVVTAQPYYPHWKVAEGYVNGWRVCRSGLNPTGSVSETQQCQDKPGHTLKHGSLVIYRCPLWVPSKPSGLKRLIHLASFALSSFPIMLRQIFWKPDVVWVVEPTLFSAPQAWLVARLCGAQAWLHVQDFEVDAAFELGILKSARLRKMILTLDRVLMRRFDVVSTISNKMLERLRLNGVDEQCIFSFPNWVNLDLIKPHVGQNSFRAEWAIADGQVVVLYSGNMGEKQGLEIVLEVAAKLTGHAEIVFVLCGDGVAKTSLFAEFSHLTNVQWRSLQPLDKLNELLNLADIHLLPQRADAAGLVMPSKLTGMLASGKPIVATALPETQEVEVLKQCGLVVAPGEVDALAEAILLLAGDVALRNSYGDKARAFAENHLGLELILSQFERKLKLIIKN
jgi:colanic acid biosynthesis glycosyl transferase WcaI